MLVRNAIKCFILWGFLPLSVTSNFAKDFYDRFYQHDYKVTFERSNIVFINKSIIDAKLISIKFNRTTTATNFSFVVYQDVNYNIEIVFQAYKFLSNEFRTFPMRFELNLCKDIKSNTGGMSQYLTCGNFTGCPIKANKRHFICNFLINEKECPPFIPEGRYMLEWTMYYKNAKMLRANDLYIIYKVLVPK